MRWLKKFKFWHKKRLWRKPWQEEASLRALKTVTAYSRLSYRKLFEDGFIKLNHLTAAEQNDFNAKLKDSLMCVYFGYEHAVCFHEDKTFELALFKRSPNKFPKLGGMEMVFSERYYNCDVDIVVKRMNGWIGYDCSMTNRILQLGIDAAKARKKGVTLVVEPTPLPNDLPRVMFIIGGYHYYLTVLSETRYEFRHEGKVVFFEIIDHSKDSTEEYRMAELERMVAEYLILCGRDLTVFTYQGNTWVQ